MFISALRAAFTTLIILSLLPLVIGFSITFIEFLGTLSKIKNIVYFLYGFLTYSILHFLIYKPFRIYVILHELTHAISALLFGGTVKSIKIKKYSGRINVRKVNPIIAISPYFFPTLTFIILGMWHILSLFFQTKNYTFLLLFFTGFSLSFHLLLTIHALLQGQSDLKIGGILLSLELIILGNCIIIALLISLILPVSFSKYFNNSIVASFNNYVNTINFIRGIWQSYG